jgi:integrase
MTPTATLDTYTRQARAERTQRAYATDWADFEGWCQQEGLNALPTTPETLAHYLAARAGALKVSSLQRRLTAIRQVHHQAGHHLDTRHPQLCAVWAGIRRTHGTKKHGKAPLLVQDLRDMVMALPDNLLGVRDRALLLVGFAGALRRSELVGLDFAAATGGSGFVEVTREGLVVTLLRSKTDQEGRGRQVGIPYGSTPHTCPVRALQDWQATAGLAVGPVFRPVDRHGKVADGRLSDKAVALVVKRAAYAAARSRGLDESTARQWAARFSGHSLRAGHVTAAAAAGVPEWVIMRQTGHTRIETLRSYIRLGSLWLENSAARLGL